VTSTAASGVCLADVFAALFPCASVTGAPKISATRFIARLETERRGVYCGAAGIITPPEQDGGVTRFAVAIRTAVVDRSKGVVEYGTGGGISWDSDPRAEWDEVLLKAAALSDFPPASLGPGDGLIETMGYDAGQVRNLGRHLNRLNASARYFGLVVPPTIADGVAAAVAHLDGAHRIRLVLGVDGTIDIESEALGPAPARPVNLCVDLEPVLSGDAGLYHKTTDRRRYDQRAGRHPEADDVVLVNERGEVTETTRANLAVRLDDRWCTPPLDCGLLPGVERSRLLADGHLVERVMTLDDLHRAQDVATMSSLRGWRPARFVPCQAGRAI
jgi:para-aminobenzoate synthetase/4-amino-4-deoxychorismate lyase